MTRLTVIIEGQGYDRAIVYPNFELIDASTNVVHPGHPEPGLSHPPTIHPQTPAKVGITLSGIARDNEADIWRIEADLSQQPALVAALNAIEGNVR